MIPVLDLPSDPEGRGHMHGRLLAADVQANVASCRSHLLGLGWPAAALEENAAIWLASAERRAPAYARELAALAASADVAPADLAILCGRYELISAADSVQQEIFVDRCAIMGVRGEKSASGGFLLAQNLGSGSGTSVRLCVLRWRGGAGEPDVIALTEAGVPGGRLGLNSQGLALAAVGTSASGAMRPRAGALPHYARCDRILRQRRFDRAIRATITPPRATAGRYILAQQDGELLGLNTWPDGLRVSYDDEGLLIYAGDPGQPVLAPATSQENASTARIKSLLGAYENGLTIDALQSVFSDPLFSPASASREEPPARWVVMDLAAREMFIGGAAHSADGTQIVRLE